MGSAAELHQQALELPGPQTLITAIKEKNLELVKECVNRGLDINYTPPSRSGHSALTEAVISGDLEIINYLIDKGAKVNNGGYIHWKPLYAAIVENASLPIVKLLVAKGASVNDVLHPNGDTPLKTVIVLRNYFLLEFLIDSGADVNRIGGNGKEVIPRDGLNKEIGKTPLSVAVLTGNFQAVKMLMEKGADPRKTNTDGTNALILAKKLDHSEIFYYMYNSDFPISKDTDKISQKNDKNLELCTPLGRAIFLEETEQVRELLRNGADPCKIGKIGKTPLLLAVESKNLETVKLLLEYGAELTINTAFLESIHLNYTDIAIYLLEKGALVNLKYRNGSTPLIESIKKQNFELVKALTDYGADLNLLDQNNKTPLSVSLEIGNTNISKHLICKGAKIDEDFFEKNNFENLKFLHELEVKLEDFIEGSHLLIKAVRKENFNAVKTVVSLGAKLDQIECDKTALVIAAENRSLGIVEFLIEAGACVELAKEELNQCAFENEDFDIYFRRVKDFLNCGSEER